jgi:ATP-dependent Clp protease adapter protein ClpS
MTTPSLPPSASFRDRPRGSLRVLSAGGVPVYLHWSCIFGGVALSAGSGFDARSIPWMILGYILVVAVHEGGHALAARILGLYVHVIRLRGLGGRCIVQSPARARDAFLVYSAGLVAQLMLFAGAMLWLRWPNADAGLATASLIFAFTAGNAFVFVVSLLPSTSRDGMQSDGRVLSQLALDRWRGRAYITATFPGLKVKAESPVFAPETSLLTVGSLVPSGFAHGVEVLNDHHTPFEFVIDVFERHFGWDTRAAVAKAIEIHNSGGLLVPLPTLAEAERIACGVTKDAEESQHAFVCRAVSRDAQHDA